MGCTTLGITSHSLFALCMMTSSYLTLMWKQVKWERFFVRRKSMHGDPEMQYGGSKELKDVQYGET